MPALRTTSEARVGAVEDLEYTVLARTSRTRNIVELELRPAGEGLAYQSGQYVLIGDRDYTVPVRSYSLANAPDPSGRISVLVTEVPYGETSTWIHRGLHVGDAVLVSGPYGAFVADPTSDAPVLCLAAGSGLAPILALAQDAVRRAGAEPFTVLFFARTLADVMDLERFSSWQRQYAGLRFEWTVTGQVGEPRQDRSPVLLPAPFEDLSGHEVFIAGAPGFVADGVVAARALGARPGHLHTEEFFDDPRPWNASAAARVHQ
jgi:CDP-4-dehydro-6-deoxyglucose reductase, E3